MGGLSVQEDINKFKNKVHIVVGSPGRLRHLIQDKHINVSAVRLLILDEADKLMEKSFEADINYIFNVLPKQKQVIMSSATYPEHTKSFIKSYVQNAQHICPDSNCVLLGVKQKICLVSYNSNIVRQTQNRFEELLKILTNVQFKQCLIFCNYQVRVTELYKLLSRKKWPAEQLYGQQDQTDRLGALKTLQEYKCRILISTDLAARGIDASNVDLVINFEPPLDWQTYLHRIGRAGRFGTYGTSVTILCEGKEEENFKTTVDPIKESITFTSMWSESGKQYINNNVISEGGALSILLCKGEDSNCENLWNLLTSTNLIEKQYIEDFGSLCKSFQNEHPVEPFDSLLESYKNNQDRDTGENNAYQHFQTLPLEEKSCSVKILINKYSNILQNQSEDNIYGNHTCLQRISESETCKNLSEQVDMAGQISPGGESTNNFSQIFSRISGKGKYDKYVNKKDSDKACEIDCNISRKSIKKGQGYDNSKYPLTSSVLNAKSIQVTKLENSTKHKDIKHFTNHYNTDDHFQKCSMSNLACSDNYNHWYNQLKLRIKQIEFAVYIHEISKM